MKIVSNSMFTLALGTIALGFATQACAIAPGTDPSQEPAATTATEQTGTTAQDLSILGIKIPEPKLTIGVGNTPPVTINPVGTISDILPAGGIKIDPIKPIDQILAILSKPVAVDVGVKVGVGGTSTNVNTGIELPGLPLPQIPDPWAATGGITIVGP